MSDRIPRRRLRWWLYEQIDRLDTYCMKHLWVPTWIQVRVGRVWQWTFKDNITLTAVEDDSPFYGVDTDKCYISGCQCGRSDNHPNTDIASPTMSVNANLTDTNRPQINRSVGESSTPNNDVSRISDIANDEGWGCGEVNCKVCY